jgi:hypothetical protein
VPNQPVQMRLRRKLEELVRVEEADLLLDRPPGGWSTLVTKNWLDERLTHERAINDARFEMFDAKLDGLRHELVGTMHKEFRGQTWRLITAMFGAVATLGTVVAMIAAATQL